MGKKIWNTGRQQDRPLHGGIPSPVAQLHVVFNLNETGATWKGWSASRDNLSLIKLRKLFDSRTLPAAMQSVWVDTLFEQ